MARAVADTSLQTRSEQTGDVRLAAIDVGSNSLHMIVAQVDADGGATILWRMKEMVGLGRNSFPAHRLSPPAIDNAILALGRFADMARRRGCEKVVAVATSAVREAENGGDFIERARQETGINVRIVSAREEARLIYLGVRHAMDFGGDPNLIIDIGGGSVEFVVADGSAPSLLESRKVGAARMTARFISNDPPTKQEVRALLDHYESELEPLMHDIEAIEPVRVVGTSGTLENLASMCGSRSDDARESATIERQALQQLVDRLLESTAADRVKFKGLDEKRQDQIIAGALLVRFIMQRLQLKRIVLCDAALREGILLDYVGRHLPDLAIRRQVPDPRRRSVLDLARKCEWNETHSMHVVRLALRLFDELAPLHGLGSQARDMLEYGAMLHDIGWHISSSAHHKHAMYLVQHGNLKEFTKTEVEVIANLTRYHRRSMPKRTHEAYVALPRSARRIVDVGGAILRIADGLDRSHGRIVQDLRCKIEKHEVKVMLEGRGDMELELWAARRKTDMFRRVFERGIVFCAEDGKTSK